MNDLQRKVCERARYLASKNEGAVNRVIHGGKTSYKDMIDEYERARVNIAKSEFALPVEEYMGKVQEISMAKDAAKEAKRQRLLKALSQPVGEVKDVVEDSSLQEPLMSQIKQKPRSAKEPKLEKALKKFEGRDNISREEVFNYIRKNVPKRRIIDLLKEHNIEFEIETGEYEVELDEDGEPILDEDGEEIYILDKKGKKIPIYKSFVINDELGKDLTKDQLMEALNDSQDDVTDKYGVLSKNEFSKAELLKLAGLNKKGEKVAGGRKVVRIKGINEGLVKNMKRNYALPDKPDPLLAEQAKAGKDEMPVDKSNRTEAAQKALKHYHKYRKAYSSFPQYGDITDRKKTMSDAFKIYKKLMEKHEGDHDKAMKKLFKIIVAKREECGGYGDVYAKKMAKLARKGVAV